MPVHQMGMPCRIHEIVALAREAGLPVVEDAACAIGSEVSGDGGATWERVGRPHGDIACFSFHPRKVLTTGDGGMATTGRADADARLRLLRQHGMSVSDTARHDAARVIIEEYVETGFNYRMTDIQAAVGRVQLGRLDGFIEKRRQIDSWYRAHVTGVPWLRLPAQPAYARSNWQSYPVTLEDGAPATRDELLQALLDRGIRAKPGIMNAHEERPYRGRAALSASCAARERTVLLPMYHEMTEADVSAVAGALGSL
jgi:dTDP-4-amino-4,6-dideoxygalactose transaminase